MKPQLDALVSVRDWKNIPADERKDMIDDTVRAARKTARKAFLSGNFGDGNIPPPPPGFTAVK
ncbi:hypothetical protein QP162_21895 [Sphingomonas aurantiaca]|uniref:hypothetical protein n=1 Tax=Sphingomonas aurantiaca TaxID=185949 RepID=UPI002FDF2D3B